MRTVGRPHFLEPLLHATQPGPCALVVDRLAAPLATTLETAFDSASRNRGLLGRQGIPDDMAMIIAPSTAIHTWFMRFPLDIVFARRDGQVVKILQQVGPWRIAVCWRAFAAIELAAGTVDRHQLRVGDRLSIVARAVTPAPAR